MKLLFVTGGSAATVYAVAPLAKAAECLGHDVVVAASWENRDHVASAGLAFFAVTDAGLFDMMTKDRAGRPLSPPQSPAEGVAYAGAGFGRLASAYTPGLDALVRGWGPDVIVGGALTFAAGIVARKHGLPYVRQAWDIAEDPTPHYEAAEAELRAELTEASLESIPEHDLFVDFTPPSLTDNTPKNTVTARWLPGNPQGRLERWMLQTERSRPRITITSGSRSQMDPNLGRPFLQSILDLPVIKDGEAEVVVATAPATAESLTLPGTVTADWVPLDRAVAASDLLIHHGGGVSALTAVNAGVPQLVLPVIKAWAVPLRRLDAQEAAITLESHNEPVETVGNAIRQLLEDTRYQNGVAKIRHELQSQTPLPSVVETIEQFV